MLINKLTTAFGDHSSLLPLFTKDIVNSSGMTAFSYNAGGKIEAKDRFIDEFGTQAIWMGGLPFFKWAIDNSVYKLAKINPDIDVRLLNDAQQLEAAKKYAASLENKSIAESLEKAAKYSAKTKGLFIGKFAAATALTLASFFTLVKVKQHYTKKEIEKQFWAKKSQQQMYDLNLAKSPAFKAFMSSDSKNVNQGSKTPSFKGIGSVLQGVMFDPVKNLFIVDAGITGERLVNSRTKTEFAETAIKEGSLLFFLYVAGRYIQEGIEKASEKFFKKPIDLHAEVLSSDYMKDAIKTGKVYDDVKAVTDLASDKKKLFELIYGSEKTSAENIVMKAAKKSGLIKTIKEGSWIDKLLGKAKDTGIIDPHQYINPDDMQSFAKNIKKLADSAPKGEKAIEEFLKKCRNMKIGSVAANMGITCLFLGLIVPYSMMKYRAKQQNGNKDFHVQAEIERQLEKSFKGRIS